LKPSSAFFAHSRVIGFIQPRAAGPAGAAARPSTGLRLRKHPAGFGLENSDQRAGLHVSLVFGAFIGVSWPSLHFSANASTRACVRSLTCIPTSARAVSNPKQRLTGSSISSRTALPCPFCMGEHKWLERKGNCATVLAAPKTLNNKLSTCFRTPRSALRVFASLSRRNPMKAELVAPKSDEGGCSQKIVRKFFRWGGEGGSLEL